MVLNVKITRKSFKNKSIKILLILIFIDDYNRYIKGINQSNQLRTSFTIYFSRNQKEFFLGTFWVINITVYNSYKLHLIPNDSKISFTSKRGPRQHRE